MCVMRLAKRTPETARFDRPESRQSTVDSRAQRDENNISDGQNNNNKRTKSKQRNSVFVQSARTYARAMHLARDGARCKPQSVAIGALAALRTTETGARSTRPWAAADSRGRSAQDAGAAELAVSASQYVPVPAASQWLFRNCWQPQERLSPIPSPVARRSSRYVGAPRRLERIRP